MEDSSSVENAKHTFAQPSVPQIEVNNTAGSVNLNLCQISGKASVPLKSRALFDAAGITPL